MRWMLLLSLLGFLTARADVTGQWNGTARFLEGGTPKQSSIRMTLVERGSEITGSVFVEDKDWQITEGQSENGQRVRLRINVLNATVQFDLTIAGDRMSGKAISTKGSDAVVEVDLTRKALARPVIDTSGIWSGTLSGKGEIVPMTLEFHQSGNEVTGVAKAKDRSAPLKGEIDGAKLTFRAERGSEKLRFALILSSDNMSGFAAIEGNGKDVVVDVELRRALE